MDPIKNGGYSSNRYVIVYRGCGLCPSSLPSEALGGANGGPLFKWVGSEKPPGGWLGGFSNIFVEMFTENGRK